MDTNEKLNIGEFYKIREENDYAILFSRKELGIMKISKTLFNILKEISINHCSVNDIINKFNVQVEDVETFKKFFNHLYNTKVVEYFKEEYTFKQVYDLRDSNLKFQAPNFVWWDITTHCNLHCYYCYSSSGCPSKDELDLKEVKEVIYQLYEMGVFYIYFLGGEPFMKKNFIDILSYCNELGLGIMVTTNGTLINDDIAKKLKEFNVTNVRVSIDSNKEEIQNKIRGTSFAYKKAIEGFKCLSKYNFSQFGISTTLGPDNYKDIDDIIELAEKYNCDHIQFNPISATGRAVESDIFLNNEEYEYVRNKLTESREKYKEKIVIDAPEGVIYKNNQVEIYDLKTVKPDIMGCGAGRTCLAIQDSGSIGYCLLERKEIGNLRKEKLKDCWSRINIELLNKEKKFCKNCKNINVCEGPCMSLDNKCECERESVMNEYLKGGK